MDKDERTSGPRSHKVGADTFGDTEASPLGRGPAPAYPPDS